MIISDQICTMISIKTVIIGSYNDFLTINGTYLVKWAIALHGMYKFFYFKIEIKTKVDSYMSCEAMAHSTKFVLSAGFSIKKTVS